MPDDGNDDVDGEEDDDHRWKSEAGSGSGLLEVCVVCRLNETRDIRLHTWLGRAGAGLRQSQPQQRPVRAHMALSTLTRVRPTAS